MNEVGVAACTPYSAVPPADSYASRMEQYRKLLCFLARTGMDPWLRRRVSPSDLAQETLIRAFEARGDLEALEEPQVVEWLRQTLKRLLINAARDHRRAKRDVRRERAFEAALSDASARLDQLLICTQPSPSSRASHTESLQRLAAAVEGLPDDYREVLILQHWKGWKVAEIAKRMGRSTGAVAMLLHRALDRLRKQLSP